jgi:hypothetical protein
MPSSTRQDLPSWTAEATFKAAVLNKMRQLSRVTPKSRIANEFVFGSTGVRADLAIFGRELTGVEIKTDRDSLKRLSRQMEAYRLHCHRVILAIAPKHLVGALRVVPDDVEIWTVRYGKVETVRRGATARDVLPETCTLLTQAERARSGIAPTAGTITDPKHVRRAVKILAARFDRTSDQFWTEVRGRAIAPEDIGLLSRFRSARELAAQTQEAQKAEWDNWESQAALIFGPRTSAIAA